MNITQTTILQIATSEIKSAVLSIPGRQILADPNSGAAEGFVRHGGVGKAIDRTPKQCKVPYQDHLKNWLSEQGDPQGTTPRSVVGFGTRNSIQNLFLPVYDANRFPALLCRRDEPLSDTYQAFCGFQNRDKMTFAIERVRFRRTPEGGSLDLPHPASSSKDPVLFAITGQPILFDFEVTPHHLIAAVTYDQRHAWHVEWEDWQKNDVHRRIHDRLMEAMMSGLKSSVTDRAAELGRIASSGRLAIEDGYFHSSLSTTADGEGVNVVMMQGSFEEIARTHKRLGARHAILLDNGGSVGTAIWSRKGWADLLSANRPAPPEPTFIGNNTYFRPRGHALILLQLEADFVERPFRGRVAADSAWSVGS